MKLRLMLGPATSAEPVKRNEEKIRAFFAVAPSGSKAPVAGVDGADPAGYLRVKEKGIYVVGYRSQDAFVELEASKFHAYLEEEGLDSILKKRRDRNETALPGRETYSRCAKALIEVTAEGPRAFDRKLDFPLELLPEKDPFSLRSGDLLPLRLEHEGRPLPGALVTAMQRDDAGAVTTSVRERTDGDGRVRLLLPAAGPWLVACVHMFESRDPARSDWESLWASLTFELPAGTESRPASRPESRR